ncbi:MAG: ubiquinol-cytochrome c reductase iron-sulfur subunit [Candidatus Binatia bacterium]
MGSLQEEFVEHKPHHRRSSRRLFLEWFLGTTFGAVALAILYPVLRFVIPPEVAESATNRVLAGTLSEMPSNSGKVFRFGSKPALVIRLPNGDVRAFTAICTHLGCTVQYRPDLQQIWCPCHNGRYNLQGVNVAGPPPRPLEQYAVAIKDDKVWVSRGA